MNEANTPERPAGRTIRVDTSNLVAPSPYAASLSPRGTDESTSSLSDDTRGMIITPTTMQAESALNVSTRRPSGSSSRLSTGVTRSRATYP